MAVAALTEGSLSSMVAGKPPRPQPQSPFRQDCLRGLVVLVTGGGSGIGLGISEAFAAHGARLTLFGRRAAVLEESCRSLRERWPSCVASACRGDVRDPDSCAAAVAACVREHGRLDILVNCAAGNFMCAAEELTPSAFRTVVDIDLQGTYNMCSAALGALSGQRGRPATAGSPLVINISATLHYKALPFQAHACAAKAGIDALTRTLGLEYGCEHGVRVVGIASRRKSKAAAQRHQASPSLAQPRPASPSLGQRWASLAQPRTALGQRWASLAQPRPVGREVLAGRPHQPCVPHRHRARPDRGHRGRADGARLRCGDRRARGE
jgi:NAD(P)-dependent dehydrogenase (short-subunit alcohol dehydrogenase family)